MEVCHTIHMNKVWADRKPLVSEVDEWIQTYHASTGVKIYEASNYYDYYKFTVDKKRPRFFFGETAWVDVQRYALDNVRPSW